MSKPLDLSILDFDFDSLTAKVRELEKVESAVSLSEQEILSTLLERLSPIVQLVASQIEISYSYTVASHGLEYPQTEYFEDHGVLICDATYSKKTADFTGKFCGSQLYYTTEGKIVRFERFGTWSQWQGSRSSWESSSEILTVEEVIEQYHLAYIVEAISEVFEEAVKKAKAKKQQLQERLEQLESVKKILASA